MDSGGEGAAAARIGMTNTFTGPNRFGRMFPRPSRFRPANESLIALAEGMRQETQTDPTPDADDNNQVPAGFTYFGQFVDHDITLDPTVGFPPVEDPENLESLRTPRLELDSVYGMGPVDQPELYDPAFPPAEARMRIGTQPTPEIPPSRGSLPTTCRGRPTAPGGPSSVTTAMTRTLSWPSCTWRSSSCTTR